MTNPTRQPIAAYVGLGSNLGDRRAHIDAGVAGLDAIVRTRVVACSTVIETDPVGPPGQGPYLNAAAQLETGLPAHELLAAMFAVEREHGRDRSKEHRWGPRTLDLDLLIYSGAMIDEPGLTVPHPRLAERAFVLVPLAELAPGLTIPGIGRTPADLLADL